MTFRNGDRVKVSIGDMGRWCRVVGDVLQGQTGTIEETKDRSINGHPAPGVAHLVRFDKAQQPDHSAYGPIDRFWMPPCELEGAQ